MFTKDMGKMPSPSDNSDLSQKTASSKLSLPTFSTKQLFGSAREIGIEHDDLLYRLRITKQGKLILNK